ncbi:hypothetical protein G7Y89_g9938 [Cudoniella acicularis]|uniref:DUF7580 domain-containing protein n=1 Tax=Cudoniella acicularis TaxID=354080 RepID=A0A8H4W1E8_9HELO|nr:hypothetical protein G7Y89_g9938 [Cudoniella acicularis]
MTGFEIVGVVLGVLPLIIQAAESYREGFEPFSKWHRFRCEFRAFINDVDLEKQLFDAMVERLLQPTDLSVEKKQDLLTGKDVDGWREPQVQNALSQRLGKSWDACLFLLEAIGEDIIKLEAMMSLKDGSVDWAKPGADRWSYQRKRISHSFSKKGTATMKSFGEKNRKFRDLLNELDLKAVASQSNQRKVTTKDTTWARIFECIRRQANSLHRALRNGWKCGCETPHLAALQLQERATSDWTSQFIMAFASAKSQRNILNSQHKLLVAVKKSTRIDSSSSLRLQPTPLQEGSVSKITLLRADFETDLSSKGDSQVVHIQANSHSLSVPGTTGGGSCAKTIARSDSSSSNLRNERSKHSMSDFWRPQRPKKTVRMNILPQDEIKKPSAVSLSVDASAQYKKTCDTTVPASEATELDVEIEDLCSALATSDLSCPCLGYLPDDEHRHHQFRSLRDHKQPPCENADLISLEKLFENSTKPSLSRKQRFRLTVVLASSLLQLQTTPWLTEKLEKRDIFFECYGCSVLADQPYIYHYFPSIKFPSAPSSDAGATQPTSGFAARTSLVHLGILLLELCFGETIESREDLRSSYLVDGKAHDQTNFLTARDWICEVEEEAGLDFQSAVKCCFDLYVKPNWTDAKFTQSIYAGVVQPLEKVVAELGWGDAP